MSIDNQSGDGENTQAADPIKNVKEEFSRKLSNTDSKIDQLAKQNEALIAQLAAISSTKAAPQAAAAKTEDLSDLMYSDPQRYAQVIEERAEARIMGKLNDMNTANQKQTSVMAGIMSDYPELGDADHQLTKKAVEIFAALDESDKKSPISYKLAAQQAAMELGVKPKSKRTESDDYSIMSSSSSSSSRKKSKKSEISPVTQNFAEIMGMDMSDEGLKQRLAERSGRNWNKYQTVKGTKK
jgi:flagellar biosynthesis/type III secretory pathway chaperone